MNLLELFCKIAFDDSDYKKGLDSALKGAKSFAHEAGDKISDFAQKAENALKTAAKIGAAALGAVSTGVGFLVSAAVQEYADYEQLVGGVDTLFKDASLKVQEYAANAYKTAGLSANEYMETVTSFSASLLQSLGGDTAAAAEKADRAITDMSDNANKMGTDMSSIQNAYQGFNKQNYTMLDNLKLGYGGTQQEMQRLLDDANALNAAQGKLTNYSIESYADIVDAIHDVQTQMGITGTTAKEAATTIQGSVNSAKSEWHNLMIGIADDNQDFDTLVNNFVDSVYTAADNILPRVETSLDGVLRLVQVASEKIVPRVISTVAEKAPDLIDAAAEIVLALVDGITDNLDRIFDAVDKTAKRVVPKIYKAFADLVPKIAKSAASIIKQIDGTVIAVGGLYGAFKSLIAGNWIGVGIGLATTAFGLAQKASQKYTESVYNLTDQEKDWIEAGEAAREELQRAKDARAESIDAIMRETDETRDLWHELQTLTDENGKVDESNHDRADYILGKLNEALGTEYSRNGDIIEQYQQMQVEIDKLIEKKQTEALLEAGKEAYTTALQNKDAALSEVSAQKTKVDNAQAEYDRALQALQGPGVNQYTAYGLLAAKDKAKEALDEAKANYAEAVAAASDALTTIDNYEAAVAANAEGRAEDAKSLLLKDTTYRWEHVDDIKKISDAEKKQLKSDLDTQRRNVEIFREQYANGTEGFTKPMLDEMEAALAELESLYAEATSDGASGGYQTGAALGDGVERGFRSRTGSLVAAAGSMIGNMVNEMLDRVNSIAGSTGTPNTKPSTTVKPSTRGFPATAQPIAQYQPAPESAPVNINITVHADTDDLGAKIADEVQSVVVGAIHSMGKGYRGGRTAYGY